MNHQLKIESDLFLENDDLFLPTGSCIKVKDRSGFDFSEFRIIGDIMKLKNEALKQYFGKYLITN